MKKTCQQECVILTASLKRTYQISYLDVLNQLLIVSCFIDFLLLCNAKQQKHKSYKSTQQTKKTSEQISTESNKEHQIITKVDSV